MNHLSGFLVGNDLVERLASLHCSATNLRIATRRIWFQINTSKVGRQLIVLILGPTLEWMIMALVAVESGCEEQLSGIFHRFNGRSEDLEVGSRRILLVGSIGSENLMNELVVGLVGFDLLMNPLTETGSALLAQILAVDLQ